MSWHLFVIGFRGINVNPETLAVDAGIGAESRTGNGDGGGERLGGLVAGLGECDHCY